MATITAAVAAAAAATTTTTTTAAAKGFARHGCVFNGRYRAAVIIVVEVSIVSSLMVMVLAVILRLREGVHLRWHGRGG
jgi:hypothetical protein